MAENNLKSCTLSLMKWFVWQVSKKSFQKDNAGDPVGMAKMFGELVEHYDEKFSWHMQAKTRLVLMDW